MLKRRASKKLTRKMQYLHELRQERNRLKMMRDPKYLVSLFSRGEHLNLEQIAESLKISKGTALRKIAQVRKLLDTTECLSLDYDPKTKIYKLFISGDNFAGYLSKRVDQQTGNTVIVIEMQHASLRPITKTVTMMISPEEKPVVFEKNTDTLVQEMNKLADEGITREMVDIPKNTQEHPFSVFYPIRGDDLFGDVIERQIRDDLTRVTLSHDALDKLKKRVYRHLPRRHL